MEQATVLTVIGGLIAIVIWFLKRQDNVQKTKKEQKKEWEDARKSNSRSTMLNILSRLRKKR